MPSTNMSARKIGASRSIKSANPFTSWLLSRKERRMEAEEEAAKLITNTIAKNQNIIVDKLSAIDFMNSKLPKSVLETKSNPDQECCDLEYHTNAMIQELIRDPQVIKMDIRKLDQKLLTLVLLFKQAVEQGDVRAAYAARSGLARAIKDIRGRIPQNQPELARQFVEVNTKYLDQWITLVGLAQVADRTKKNLEDQKVLHAKAEEKDNKATEELRRKILENSEYRIAFANLINRKTGQDRSRWTAIEREVHRALVERRMGKVNLELNSLLLQQQEVNLSAKVAQVEMMSSKVTALPIATDPDLMNKFQESIDDLFKQLAESDAQIDETLKTMDDIEGRIQQLSRAGGSIRAREVAAEEAERALEDMKRLENKQAGKTVEEGRQILEQLGLHTDEELKEMKEIAEREEQQALAEILEQAYEQQEEQELLVN